MEIKYIFKMNTFPVEEFTKNETRYNIKLKIIRNIKRSFEKNFSKLKLKPLVIEAGNFRNEFASVLEGSLLLKHGISIVEIMGKDPSLDRHLLDQLENTIKEISRRDGKESDTLIPYTWQRLQKVKMIYSEFSEKLAGGFPAHFERVVLSFLENSAVLNYCAKISAESPQLFQTVTAILYNVLTRTEGHDRIISLVSSFVGATMSFCQKEQRNFFGLYPKDCTHLVPLLIISPDEYSVDSDKNRNQNLILSFMHEMFLKNRRKLLLLLSHYPDWMFPFQIYLDQDLG